jgi:hypothetical protein
MDHSAGAAGPDPDRSTRRGTAAERDRYRYQREVRAHPPAHIQAALGDLAHRVLH